MPMRNILKERVRRGKKSIGTLYELNSPVVARCLAISGMDFIFIDTEHGPYDVEATMAAITAINGFDVAPLVRVKDSSRNSVLKMLDIGAQGVIVPNVESVEEVRDLVKFSKYYPLGNRGFAPSFASDYGFADFAVDLKTQFEVSNRETLLLPQCETLGCLENIDEICSIEGVDGIFVGPYDLSVALGVPGKFDEPIMTEAIMHILASCKKYGKLSLIFARDIQRSIKYFEKGFDCVACGLDAVWLIEACAKICKDVKRPWL